MHQVKYALFYDFHTSPNHPDVGDRFDAEKLTDRFLECGVDYVTFHARCNMGMAYYDTAIGIKHPSLRRDLFGELAEACARKRIALGAYFNAGISRAEGVAHMNWATLRFDGTIYGEPRHGPFSMTMCYNSPYRDHLLAMTLEVAEKYPVKGFFFDCMGAFPCVCPNCIERMRREDVDFTSFEEVKAFGARSAAKLAQALSDALRKVDPEYLLYFNDISFEDQQSAGNYLEFECLPNKDCGYAYMHTMPHYMRTLGKPCVHMTGRFNQWSDFGGLRNINALKYELNFAIANGMRPNIGDHLLPDGSVNETVFTLIRNVYGELHRYDEWLDSIHTAAEIAIVYPKQKSQIGRDPEILGAIRILTELRMQFDIVTKATDWSRYSVLVFPDSVEFDKDIKLRVMNYLAAGGKILASGQSGLDSERNFPDAWGISFVGKTPFNPAYFQMTDPAAVGGDMPFSFYGQGFEVEPHQESRVFGYLVSPAVNFGWDGIFPEYYNPPYEKTLLPFLTMTEQTAYFSGNLFTGYNKKAPVQLRQVVGFALAKLFPEPMIKIHGVPSFLQAFVTRGKNALHVHLLGYLPEKRGADAEIIEDEMLIPGFRLCIRLDFGTPSEVYLAPERKQMTFEQKGAYIEIQVPSFSGFCLICVAL